MAETYRPMESKSEKSLFPVWEKGVPRWIRTLWVSHKRLIEPRLRMCRKAKTRDEAWEGKLARTKTFRLAVPTVKETEVQRDRSLGPSQCALV